MPTVGLVLPTTSYRGPDFVAAADELGVDLVVATDGSLGLTSGRIVDVVPIDCSDPETAARSIESSAVELDAIVGVDDGGVLVAAHAAQRLDLPHNDPGAVAATRDKAVMRGLLAAAGVAQPESAAVEDRDPDHVGAVASGIGYPVVIKPVSLSASRGVIRVDGPDELAAHLSRLDAIVREAGLEDEPILVERFVPGPEVAVEGLLSVDGLEVLAVFDKPDPLDGPFFEETIYTTPSRHPAGHVAGAVELVERAVDAIGLRFGPIHAEVRLSRDGPCLIEVAARSIGGLCGRALRFGMLSQSLEVLLLRAALGMNRRGIRPVDRASGAMMIPIPGTGVLRAVSGMEAVAEVEGITDLTITVPLGRPVRPLPEGDRYLGFIVAEGIGPGEVEGILREAHGLLSFDIRPEA